MPNKIRYNKVIDLLEQGKPAFVAGVVGNGNVDELTFIGDSQYDGVIIETEHEGFSFDVLRVSLQCLLNRKRIADKGSPQPDVVPLVRIPPNGRDRDQWVIKQTLDAGAYGFAMSSNYNLRRRPAEVVVEEGAFRVVREAETESELVARELGRSR